MTDEEKRGTSEGVLALGQISQTLGILRQAIATDIRVAEALALVEAFAADAATKLDEFTV